MKRRSVSRSAFQWIQWIDLTPLSRAGGYWLGYTLWTAGFQLLTLTLITYFLMSSNAKFQEISDAFGSNELTLMGFGAVGFVLLLKWLNPLTSTTREEIFTSHRFERRFAPGFLHGSVLGLAVTLAFLLSGLYKYLGFFIQVEEAPLAGANVVFRAITLGCLAYCEEFIFRHKIMNFLRQQIPDLYAAVVTAALYCLSKMVQFDLGIMQMLTMFLLALSLAVRTIADGDFVRGAGYWTGLLVVFHALLSLPVLGNEFQGVLLVKYEQTSFGDGTARFLTGGIGGPLSSFGLQLLLILDVAQGLYKNKKILLNRRFKGLH